MGSLWEMVEVEKDRLREEVIRDGTIRAMGEDQPWRGRPPIESIENPWVRDLYTSFRGMTGNMLATVSRVGGLFTDRGFDPDEVHRYVANLEASAALKDQEEGLLEWPHRTLRGGVQSIGTFLATAPGGPGAVIGTFAAQRGSEALTEATDAGLTGTSRDLYAVRAAVIEGGITSIFQRLGFGGLEQLAAGGRRAVWTGMRDGLKQVGVRTGHELLEEHTIAILDAINQSLSQVNPEAVSMKSLQRMAFDTTMQTIFAMGTIQGAQVGIGRLIQGTETITERDKGRALEAPLEEQKFTKQELLTPEGATAWANENPADAAEILASAESAIGHPGTPSRQTVFKRTGQKLDGWDRKRLAELLAETEAVKGREHYGGELRVTSDELRMKREGRRRLAELPGETKAERGSPHWLSVGVEVGLGVTGETKAERGREREAVDEGLASQEEPVLAGRIEVVRAMVHEDGGYPTKKEVRAALGVNLEEAGRILKHAYPEWPQGRPGAAIGAPEGVGVGIEAERLAEAEDGPRRGRYGLRPEAVWQREPPRGRRPLKAEAPGIIDEIRSLKRPELEQRAREHGIKFRGLKKDAVHRRVIQAEMRARRKEQPSAAEEAAEQADAVRAGAETSLGFVAPYARPSRRAGQSQNLVQAPNPETERRIAKAHGQPIESWGEWIKGLATAAWHKSTRAQEYLPKSEFFAPAREMFRRLNNFRNQVSDQGNRYVATILAGLDADGKALLERYLLAKDNQERAKRGEMLTHGLTRAELDQWIPDLEQLLEENPVVQQAIETRERIRQELVDKAQDMGVLPEDLDREFYFHHQVLAYQELQKIGGGGRKAGPTTQSFQKARVKRDAARGDAESFGEEWDSNSDYIESETAWMTDALNEIAKAQWRRELNDVFGVEELQEGYEAWQPRPGNVLHRSFSIPDKIIEQLQSGILAEAEITADQLREVLAIGGPQESMILPKEIVTQLETLEKPKPTGSINAVWKEAMKWWKAWHTVMSPERTVGHYLRNYLGDLDPVIGTAPQILRRTGKSFRDLRNYYNQYLSLSAEMRAARDNAVIDSSLMTEDIPHLRDLKLFERFYSSAAPLAKIPQKYYETVWKAHRFRENMLRYSAFLYAREALARGSLKHYGGASKETVESIKRSLGVDAAAAHYARNLLGDYGDRTVLGNWIRQNLIPYWSFQEINLQRTPRLVINAIKSGQGRGRLAAVIATVNTLRIAKMYGCVWVWNNLLYPALTGDDPEEELAPWDRQSPHIIYGKNPDGSYGIFRNVGAVGEFMEWFGLNDLIALAPEIQAGQISKEDLLKELWKVPANKFVQGIRPDIKTPIEVGMGRGLFPDFTSPRQRPRGELAAGMLGLQDEYNALRGAILKDGSRARPHYLQRILGVTDPRQNAMSEMWTLAERFHKKKGKDIPDFSGGSKFSMLRRAAVAQNYGAFTEARQAYLKDDGTPRKFVDKIKRMDPLSTLNKRERIEFELDFLNDQQRDRLRMARDHTYNLRDRMLTWWEKASDE